MTLFQIQMRRDGTEEFVAEGKESADEAKVANGLRTLNWIEYDFQWRMAKFVDGVMVAIGKVDWSSKENKVIWEQI